MKRIPIVLIAVLAGAAAVVAQGNMRPGRWEISSTMEMAGSPVQMPPMKTTRCVTPEDAKDPAASLQQGPGGRGGKNDCKVSDQKVSGNTVSWKMACAAPQSMTGTGEITFKDDSYTGTMKMTTPQGSMSMKMDGKRLGDCQ
jgi:Protein of unknown function (DUF3617)